MDHSSSGLAVDPTVEQLQQLLGQKQKELDKAQTHNKRLKAFVSLHKEKALHTAELLRQRDELQKGREELAKEAAAQAAARQHAEEELQRAKQEAAKLQAEVEAANSQQSQAVGRQPHLEHKQQGGVGFGSEASGRNSAGAGRDVCPPCIQTEVEMSQLRRQMSALADQFKDVERLQKDGHAQALGLAAQVRQQGEALREVKDMRRQLVDLHQPGPSSRCAACAAVHQGLAGMQKQLQPLQEAVGTLTKEVQELRAAVQDRQSQGVQQQEEWTSMRRALAEQRERQAALEGELLQWRTALRSFASLATVPSASQREGAIAGTAVHGDSNPVDAAHQSPARLLEASAALHMHPPPAQQPGCSGHSAGKGVAHDSTFGHAARVPAVYILSGGGLPTAEAGSGASTAVPRSTPTVASPLHRSTAGNRALQLSADQPLLQQMPSTPGAEDVEVLTARKRRRKDTTPSTDMGSNVPVASSRLRPPPAGRLGAGTHMSRAPSCTKQQSPAPNGQSVKADTSCAKTCTAAPSSGGTRASLAALLDLLAADSTAAEVVEAHLANITRNNDPTSAVLIAAVAEGLHGALAAGRCPVQSVLGGFGSAVLECAASNFAPSATQRVSMGGRGTHPVHASTATSGGLEQRLFSRAWCGEAALQHGTVSALLKCAQALHCMGLPAPSGSVSGTQGAAAPQRDFLALLQNHLHQLAGRAPPDSGMAGASPHFETEACALMASATSICCMRDNAEAVRVWLFDLLMVPGPKTLPRIAAALSAWPQALPRLPSDPAPAGLAHASGDVLLYVLHAALQSLCSAARAGQPSSMAQLEAADIRAATVEAADCLQLLGRQLYGWKDESSQTGTSCLATLQAAGGGALETLQQVVARGAGAGRGQDDWQQLTWALQLVSAHLGWEWAYERVIAAHILPAIEQHVQACNPGIAISNPATVQQWVRLLQLLAAGAASMVFQAAGSPVAEAAALEVCQRMTSLLPGTGRGDVPTSVARQAAQGTLQVVAAVRLVHQESAKYTLSAEWEQICRYAQHI